MTKTEIRAIATITKNSQLRELLFAIADDDIEKVKNIINLLSVNLE